MGFVGVVRLAGNALAGRNGPLFPRSSQSKHPVADVMIRLTNKALDATAFRALKFLVNDRAFELFILQNIF